MKNIKKLMIIVPVLLAVVTPGAGDMGTTNLNRTCQQCVQILAPLQICDSDSETIQFCGAESWIVNTSSTECKRFLTHTRHCVNGGTQTWTDSVWSGIGTDCKADGSEHDCY